ncbi:MAG: hypothetical protein RSH24_01270 [Flavobacterium sp.]
MEERIFTHILKVIENNDCEGISRDGIDNLLGISYDDFIDLVNDRSYYYGLRPRVTKQAVFFTKI